MIKRSLFYAALIVLSYSAFTVLVKPQRYRPQTQWQENAVRAQKFLYNSNPKLVVLGSSLAARLNFDSQPGYYNLAFSGQSVFDGLAILKKKSTLPKRVLIEINTLNVPLSDEFIASQLNPFMYQARRFNLAFRDGKQPSGLIAPEIARKLSSPANSTTKTQTVRSKDLRNQLIADQVRKYADTAIFDDLEKSALALKSTVSFLQQKGVEVIFFELPVEKVLCHSAKSQKIREIMLRTFPAGEFRHITQPDCEAYRTTDGIHLTPAAARRFASYLTRVVGT